MDQVEGLQVTATDILGNVSAGWGSFMASQVVSK
jgi:hypothetical protein